MQLLCLELSGLPLLFLGHIKRPLSTNVLTIVAAAILRFE